MKDHANLYFKNYIPDKDINKNILAENPAQSNLQEVPVLDDFVKTKTLLVHKRLSRLIIKWESFKKHFCRLWVHYQDSGRDWKVFQTSLLKLLRYLRTHLLH